MNRSVEDDFGEIYYNRHMKCGNGIARRKIARPLPRVSERDSEAAEEDEDEDGHDRDQTTQANPVVQPPAQPAQLAYTKRRTRREAAATGDMAHVSL